MPANKLALPRFTTSTARLIALACAAILGGCGAVEALLHDQFTSDPDYLRIKTENQAQKQRWLAEKEQANAATSSSSIGMLDAAAQAAANGGGGNSAQYQAIATPGISRAEGLTQKDYAGVNLGKNVRFDKPVNECIGLVNMPKQSTYDSPGPGLTNKCSFPIMVYWCADAVEAGGFANNMCAQHFNGKYSLEPGQKSKLEQIVSLKAFRAIACKKPFTSGGSQTIKWSGDDFRAPCINSSIYNWN